MGQVDTAVSYGQPTIRPVLDQPRRVVDKYFPNYGGTCPPKLCIGHYRRDGGRVASNIARIRLEAHNGRTHDVPVVDGWFALAWADGNPAIEQRSLTISEYDKTGKALKSVEAWTW